MNNNLLDKEEIHILAEIAYAALDWGDPRYAEVIFSALRFVSPREPGVYIGWALSFLQQNRREDALSVLQKDAVEAGAYNEEVELFTAMTLRQLGLVVESTQRLQRLSRDASAYPVKNVASLVCQDSLPL
ncbi:tetratricopeptide repeat protein [Candidatus Ichthyocystis hellenicum]|uniref:tetratricopeptide repeat protein n=1 Tax=Candidatus Ichthyocystis hellenicum TaxID=1561003 RepID=UPI000B85581A|nr:hypothetical protein [Candidatus Ichthyocystis hellenicum]